MLRQSLRPSMLIREIRYISCAEAVAWLRPSPLGCFSLLEYVEIYLGVLHGETRDAGTEC